MLTLGIDASTQSCSGLVLDTAAGNVLAEASVNFGEALPHYGAPTGFIPGGAEGEVHSDPLMWLEGLEYLFEALGKQCELSKIQAIAGAGQQHGSVYLNNAWFDRVRSLRPEVSLTSQLEPALSRATAPIWMDTSTAAECEAISEAMGGADTVCRISGSIPIERFTGPQIRKFCQITPEAYAATARIHLVSSFLCSVLTGRDAPIDTGDGAGMNLLNIQTWEWDTALLEATAPGLRERLPSVCRGDRVVGPVAPYFVKRFGINPEARVSCFTGDNPSSLVGMGASSPGRAVISLGTSDTFFAAMPEAKRDPAGFGHVFGNPTGGGAMSLQCFANGSLAREKVKERFNMDWAGFAAALSKTVPGNRGDQMLPFFLPEISPRCNRGGPILSGSPAFEAWECPEAGVRACVEGQFINMKERTAWMGLKPRTIFMTGGASANDAIAQVAADVFQAAIERLSVRSSVALGAAMRAAVHSGGCKLEKLETTLCRESLGHTLHPTPESKAAYEETIPAWVSLADQCL